MKKMDHYVTYGQWDLSPNIEDQKWLQYRLLTENIFVIGTLTLKHQLKLAYRIISQNILSSEIQYGNVISISNDTVPKLYKKKLN